MQSVVSIIIPAHNEEKWIAACLESVLSIDDYPYKEVIVVDDASTDNTSEILKRFPITVIRTKKRVGPSSARNIGVREAKGEIIVFIDAHCIVKDSHWIQKFLRFFSDPKVGAVGGYFKRETNRKGPSLTFSSNTQQRLVKSANAAYRKSAFEQVGGFDCGLEWAGDAVLTFKIRKSGWKIVHSRDIMVIHAEKIWSIKRAFFYGSCFFPLLLKYSREIINKKFEILSIGIGLLITLGLIADLLFRLPIFTLSFLLFLSMLNSATHNVSRRRMLVDGFYTTIWSFVYYLGALYGGFRSLLVPKEVDQLS